MPNELRIQNGLFLDNLPSVNQTNLLAYNSSSGNVTYMTFAAASTSYPITSTGSTIYSTIPSSVTSFNATNTVRSIFLGESAGAAATNASSSIFLGYRAGFSASSANNSIHIGFNAGYLASGSANYSYFIGTAAGFQAVDAGFSVFIGQAAGQGASKANNSTFIGDFAAYNAASASYSTFIGGGAGSSAISSSYSTYIGNYAGSPLDQLSSNSPGAYNIAIGANVTLAPRQTRAINIGGIIFATGSYSGSAMLTGSVGTSGRVGIGTATPTSNVHVVGSGSIFKTVDNNNNITFEVLSDATTFIGTSSAPALHTTVIRNLTAGITKLYELPTSSYSAYFVDLIAVSGTVAPFGGGFTAVRTGSTVATATGYTAAPPSTFTFGANVSASQFILSASVSTGNTWNVKAIIRAI